MGAELVSSGTFGCMVATHGDETGPVPLTDVVAGGVKMVPADHEWIQAARAVGTGLGD